ncbi:SDR family NAD(P)-dependent oxidoreductase [Zavarzinia sp. CC-PAN008]|uniref:SDR family NAD(P)-dependent oxidoreductase n=1 Tax=Zavarzinia sp. CC-PAN008 TaxID=3243332 RepID=UPI003F742842
MTTGRTALITGAAGGIGLETARRLLADGWRVALCDVSPTLPDLLPGLPGQPADRMAVLCDVADADSVHEAVARVTERLGPIQGLVNNAGIVDHIAPIPRMKPEKWAWELGVNLSGPFHLIQAVAPGMAEGGFGRIVNIASMAARMGLRNQAAYSSSKAGLLGLARVVVAEYAAQGITCNTVLPGMMATPKVMGMPPHIMERAVAGVPCGRVGRLDEIAALIAFLLSDIAGYINGAEIAIDGGSGANVTSLSGRKG